MSSTNSSPAGPEENPLPFAGLKVVEVATWIAAPVAATLLADLGADVVKVEPPGEGDPYRALPEAPNMPKASGVNYTWIMDARGKRSITLNLKHPAGRGVLERLVRESDVYITNQPLPVRERLGLTWEALQPLNQRMIYASLTAFGESGTERDSPGFDQVAYWARSGLGDLIRFPGAPPAQGAPGMGDHPSGVSLYAAIVTALFRRERTGHGGRVHTSLHANGFWSAGCLAMAALAGAEVRPAGDPAGSTKTIATHVLYETLDGRWLQLNMVRTPEQIAALLGVLGLSHLLDDPRFATPEDRAEHGAELSAHLAPAIHRRELSDWIELLRSRGVPASHVARLAELAQDEQAKQNGVLLPAAPGLGVNFVINHPVQIDGARSSEVQRPPELNEHGAQILDELGYSAAEVSEMERSGAL